MNRVVALGAVFAAALPGAASAANPSPADLAITVAALPTAEAGEIVRLTVTVANRGPGSAEQPRVTVALGDVRFRPHEATAGWQCVGVTTVECQLPRLSAPADSGSRSSFVIPVRSNGFGPRTINATVASDAPDPNEADNAAATTIRFYVVNLRALRTSPVAAGRRFVFSATLIRDDTGATVAPSWLRCSGALARFVAGIRSPPLRTTHTTQAGRVTCALVVPPHAHGKFLIGTLLARARGDFTAKLVFWRRVP
jgi:hypothetical protein